MEENFVGIYENVFSQEFCNRLINFFDNMESSGLTISRQEQGQARTSKDDLSITVSDDRVVGLSGTPTMFKPFIDTLWDNCYRPYAARYSVLTTSVLQHYIYHIKVQKTIVGGGYHVWHCECADRTSSTRVLTFIAYLNDVYEGGETEFLYYPKRVKPKAGTVVLFPGAFTHTHRGNPPISNTKYIVTGWIEF